MGGVWAIYGCQYWTCLDLRADAVQQSSEDGVLGDWSQIGNEHFRRFERPMAKGHHRQAARATLHVDPHGWCVER